MDFRDISRNYWNINQCLTKHNSDTNFTARTSSRAFLSQTWSNSQYILDEINQSGPRNSSSSLSSSSQNHCNHHHHQHQNLRLSPSIPLFLEKSFTNSANRCSANDGENDRRAASITNLLRTDTVARSVSQNTAEQVRLHIPLISDSLLKLVWTIFHSIFPY